MAIQDQIPKSRLTLTYKTEVHGEPEIVELPLRLLVMGDFSLGSSADRKDPETGKEVDLDERRLRSLDGTNTDAVMKDMGMRLQVSVPNKIDPENAEDLNVDIPIDSVNAFSPDKFAMSIPKLRGLICLKRLLEQVQADISNKKKFRRLLSELYSSEAAFKKIVDEFKDFGGMKLPEAD